MCQVIKTSKPVEENKSISEMNIVIDHIVL